MDAIQTNLLSSDSAASPTRSPLLERRVQCTSMAHGRDSSAAADLARKTTCTQTILNAGLGRRSLLVPQRAGHVVMEPALSTKLVFSVA